MTGDEKFKLIICGMLIIAIAVMWGAYILKAV
jgi:hypothetical protein